ncbi:putative apoptotic chromatin condensation inducer in the nucleus-like isoform X1 [Apostichopus japonicus]|uniref:Putative apoptotic chromatin condensation inducer in the nucleus-like isoform X1 n=1 Tax=Stichopus japonicus TaxID=307972 RepID=A0A2G8KH41_STIJA|nr:putative apoptotic chromatin condensation inducer in the nucleus-like isoform X1 [Apostichopus japonicus]
MAEPVAFAEELTIKGKALDTLRVVELKQELKKRGLPTGGSKVQLIDRLKAQLELEQLQKNASSSTGITQQSFEDESVSSNAFVKQYLREQQELLEEQRREKATTAMAIRVAWLMNEQAKKDQEQSASIHSEEPKDKGESPLADKEEEAETPESDTAVSKK